MVRRRPGVRFPPVALNKRSATCISEVRFARRVKGHFMIPPVALKPIIYANMGLRSKVRLFRADRRGVAFHRKAYAPPALRASEKPVKGTAGLQPTKNLHKPLIFANPGLWSSGYKAFYPQKACTHYPTSSYRACGLVVMTSPLQGGGLRFKSGQAHSGSFFDAYCAGLPSKENHRMRKKIGQACSFAYFLG